MFSKKEIQIILVLSVIVLFVSGVVFAAHSHFSKEMKISDMIKYLSNIQKKY